MLVVGLREYTFPPWHLCCGGLITVIPQRAAAARVNAQLGSHPPPPLVWFVQLSVTVLITDLTVSVFLQLCQSL